MGPHNGACKLLCPWALGCVLLATVCVDQRFTSARVLLHVCALPPMCACGEEGVRANTVEEPVAGRVRVIFPVFVVSVPSFFARVVGARDWT